MMAARKRLPRGYRRQPSVRATAATGRGMLAALQALYAPAQELSSEEMLAELEQRRIDAAAAEHRQGVLHLRGDV